MVSNLYDLCRICVKKSKTGINIFSEDKASTQLRNKLYLSLKIIIKFDESLPTLICKKCIKELNVAYDFHIKISTFHERFSFHTEKERHCIKKINTIAQNQSEFPEEYEHAIEHCFPESPNIKESNKDMNDYFCNICNKTLKSINSLERHKILMHFKRRYSAKVAGIGSHNYYPCNKCSYSTPHKQTLVNHLRRHNGEKPFVCYCGKSFTQSSTLNAHLKTHSNDRFYTCAICGKQFKHNFSLKNHLQVHEVGSFECNTCQKILKSKRSLKDHIRRHSNVHNFNCEECGKTFVTSSELINHKKVHGQVKKMECNLCGYKTSTKTNLISHLKRHTGEKAFSCKMCTAAFHTAWDLKRHKTVHTREKCYSCPICTQRFTHSSSVNKHMLVVHGLQYKWADLKKQYMKVPQSNASKAVQ